MSDLDHIKSKLKKLPPTEREEIARLTGLDLDEEGSSTPLESRPVKFGWIRFLMLTIGPWAFLIWMGIDIAVAFVGAAAGLWSVYSGRAWLLDYERRQKLDAKMYGEVDDNKGENE